MIVAAMTLFTVMSALVKAASVRVPAGEAVFFRALLSMPLIAGWLAWRGTLRAGLRTLHWRRHAMRGVAGSVAMGLGFAGVALLPLAEATAITFVMPILLVVFAALLLGERFRAVRMLAVAVGLVGVTMIVWPRLGQHRADGAALIGVALMLGNASLAALAQVYIKSMSGTERVTAIVFYFSATATLLALISWPLGTVWPVLGAWVWPDGFEAALLVGAGVLGCAGQLLLTGSYRHADAGALAPFTYVSMLWALGIGYVWFDEVPTGSTLAGAALVIGAGLLIVLRERALGRDATARRKVRAKGMT